MLVFAKMFINKSTVGGDILVGPVDPVIPVDPVDPVDPVEPVVPVTPDFKINEILVNPD